MNQDQGVSQEDLVSTKSEISLRGSNKLTKSKVQLSTKQKWTVGLICAVNFLKYMDRYTIAGVLTDIKLDFGLTNAQAGLLQTAFIVVYLIVAPIFGFLGDRFSRKVIMCSGILVWSLSTLIGSFMQDYGGFLAMRCMVGVGEAGFSTIAPTLIADILVGDDRTNVITLYSLATPMGSGLGVIVATAMAMIAEAAMGDDSTGDPWRWGLRLTPILGFISLALMITFLEEPPRGEVEGGSKMRTQPYYMDLIFLLKNPSYVLSTIAFTFVTYVTGALAWFGVNYFEMGVELEGDSVLTPNSISLLFGINVMLAGIIGVPLGTYVGKKLRPTYPKADPLVCGWGSAIAMPLLTGGIFLVGHETLAGFFVAFIGQIFMNLNWAIVQDISFYVVIPTVRSSGQAIQISFSHAFGDAISPYIVGKVADAFVPIVENKFNITSSYYDMLPGNTALEQSSLSTGSTVVATTEPYDDLFTDYKSLQWSLVICVGVELLSALFFFWNAYYIEEDKEKCDKMIKESMLDNEEKSKSDKESINTIS